MEDRKIIDTAKIKRVLLDTNGMNTAELSRATGVHYQTLYKYQTGQYDIPSMRMEFAIKLNDYYDKTFKDN